MPSSHVPTLLPEARIDFFTRDAQTLAMGQALSQDWRFARIKIRLAEGDIATAIQRYGTEKSPDILVIETNAVDDSFTRHLEALANVCDSNTAAVFIGPENDIALYRRLLEMGATDYLFRPFPPEKLIEILSHTLVTRLGTAESRLITVMGAKGGVGTSRLSQLLGHALAQQGHPTTLLDCGSSWGVLPLSYGREPMTNLRDLATLARTQPDQLDDIRQKIDTDLYWIAASGDPLLSSTLTSDGFEGIVDHLMRRQPNIVVDLSQSATGIRAMAFAKAHHIVLVTTATALALRNTRLLLREIANMRGNEAPVHILVNQTGLFAKDEVPMRDITAALKLPIVTSMAFQPALFAALDIAEGDASLRHIRTLTPLLLPLVGAITGKKIPLGDNRSADSFLQRLLKKGS